MDADIHVTLTRLLPAIRAVVEHYWNDEERDFHGYAEEEGANHIYHDLKVLREALGATE